MWVGKFQHCPCPHQETVNKKIKKNEAFKLCWHERCVLYRAVDTQPHIKKTSYPQAINNENCSGNKPIVERILGEYYSEMEEVTKYFF